MEIDDRAPMVARKEIIVAATVEKLWAMQADINHWPEWQPGVTSAHLDGDVAIGSVFRWKGGGLNITSILQIVEPPHRIGWTGKAIGIDAVHIWTFEPHGDGTRVTSEESWSGWLTRILKLFDPHMLEKSVDTSLQVLKTTAEQA